MLTKISRALKRELIFNIDEGNLQVRAEQLRARLRLYPVMILLQMAVEPLFVYMFWDRTEHIPLLVWLLCIYSVHAGDGLLWLRQRDKLNTVEECRRWSTNFNIFTLLTALLWGSVALWFYPTDLVYEAIMICIALGLVAGAVTLDSAYPPALYLYVLGVTVPLLGRLMLANDSTHWILVAMILLFLIGSFSAGRELSRTFIKSLLQRHENDYLIEELTRQKVIAELANRDKSRFLASASHDLRQPLQALVLFSESLQEISHQEEARHLAGQISKSVGALVDMFDELLDISKLDAGVIKPKMQNFPVQPLLDRLQSEFLPLSLSKGITLEMPGSELICFSDPMLVERILRNLLSNAIRYTDFGKVRVCCTLAEGELQFTVNDTGIGIRAKSLPHIFDEYYQVDNQHRDRQKGLGLGLAIVRRIESLISTRIHVESRPALGSSFTFCLPQGEVIQPSHADTKLPSRHDVSGIIVALVDDNLDIRTMASKLMRQWGCTVYEGELPQDVMEAMATAGVRPDLLICDYRLPNETTALDGIRQLREHWAGNIPTIVLTGDTAPQTLQEIQASGALLLHKPIAPARLRSIIYFALHNETFPEIPQ